MAVTKITTNDFGSLITPVHRDYFFDAYYESVDKEYTDYFKVTEMGMATETFQHVGGFGMPIANTEGGTINETSMSEGDTATLTSTRYDLGYDITHEMCKQDLSGVLAGGGMINGVAVDNAPQTLGRGFAQKEELEAAKVLADGFGNTGYDGVSTFNNSHPLADSSNTFDNLASGALTPTNLKNAIILGRKNARTEDGLLTIARYKYLVVPPELVFTAEEIVGASNQAYEMSNTPNAIGGLEIKVNDYLPETGGTYATTNWFLISPDVKNLIFGWYERPWFDVEKTQRTVDFFAYGYMHFATGCVNARGVIGSTGT
jgi:hypothetical protein